MMVMIMRMSIIMIMFRMGKDDPYNNDKDNADEYDNDNF